MKMSEDFQVKPIISAIQKIALYETKNKYFLVGSNNNLTKFRVLKIDRTEPYDLVIIDDQVEYTEAEVQSLFHTSSKVKGAANMPKPISAFGIVGFVQFLEGHYLILVTKRRPVAAIGLHVIYKIEDTCLIYIPHEHYRIPNSDEPRYLKMFQSVDLSSNFYFSYSYDITHSYQINDVIPDVTHLLSHKIENESLTVNKPLIHGVRYAPNRKFVWNDYLLSKIEGKINNEWILYITHGFISQSNVSIFGRSVYVTLIARRSNKYAGTRFLKRGGNYQGNVANEVETEQMVIDVGTSFSNKMRVSSFVQMRGSIPCQWSQEMSKMVAKPPITFDVSDPYYEIAGAHFNELLRRYGSPIIILNLVKKREKKKHESQLTEQLNSAVNYLNLFLPPIHQIQYVSFDMARINKRKEAKVMGGLAKIARSAISKTGLFVKNGPPLIETVIDRVHAENSVQTGVIRVNCVDCLDRTNTAQFALGKCALAYQLYYLGLLDHPSLEFDSDCVRLLEVLYEDHGDTLALQYGGSQLVHRVKTYRKTAPWTSQGNDIMQTLSRYYRNTFSDTEKQHAINLFLGLYIPKEHNQPIWEQNIDYYLHHPEAVNTVERKRIPLTQWWDEEIVKCLPLAHDYTNKKCLTILPNLKIDSEMIDIYLHYHRTDMLSKIFETYEFEISHSIRDFMPQCVTDYSPFTVRIRPGRMREETAKNGNMRNPSLTGKSSTSSNNSSSSSSYESDDEEETHHYISQYSIVENEVTQELEILPEENIYGISSDSFKLKEKDRLLYEKYELIDRISTTNTISPLNEPTPEAVHTNQKQFEFKVPVVTDKSTKIYDNYVYKISRELISDDTLSKYRKYVNNELRVFRNVVLSR